MIPDSIWPDYQRTLMTSKKEHYLIPTIYGLIASGTLSNLTWPIHKHILKFARNNPGSKFNQLRDHYKIKYNCSSGRHAAFKRTYGHYVELAFTGWLEQRLYRVKNLELIGGQNDIEARRFLTTYFFEAKHIGVSDEDFNSICNSIDRKGALNSWCDGAVINFVYSKIFDAALQLRPQSRKGRKVAAITIDEFSFEKINFYLKQNCFFDWKNPNFVSNNIEKKAQDFLNKTKKRYQEKHFDVSEAQNILDEIWFFRESSLVFERKYKISIKP